MSNYGYFRCPACYDHKSTDHGFVCDDCLPDCPNHAKGVCVNCRYCEVFFAEHGHYQPEDDQIDERAELINANRKVDKVFWRSYTLSACEYNADPQDDVGLEEYLDHYDLDIRDMIAGEPDEP